MEMLKNTFGQLFSLSTLTSIAQAAVRVVVIAILAKIALSVGHRIIDRVFHFKPDTHRWRNWDEKRAKTVSSLVKSVVNYTVYFVAGVMVLDTIGLNTSSLLAAAGIAGLAVGFGAQNLVKDVVSGFFILVENQFQVGDYVTVAGVSGTVEYTGLRTTWIRSFSGEVQIIPNGEMRKVTNHMGPKMRVLVNLAIAHEEDPNRAIEVLTKAFERAKERGELDDFVAGPRVLGIQNIGEDGIELGLWGQAKTMRQFEMTRVIRAMARQALVDAGIRTGYVRRHVLLDGDLAATPIAGAEADEASADDPERDWEEQTDF